MLEVTRPALSLVERRQLRRGAWGEFGRRLLTLTVALALGPPLILIGASLLHLIGLPLFVVRALAWAAVAVHLGFVSAISAAARRHRQRINALRRREQLEGTSCELRVEAVRAWRVSPPAPGSTSADATRRWLVLSSGGQLAIVAGPPTLASTQAFPRTLRWRWMPLSGDALYIEASVEGVAFEAGMIPAGDLGADGALVFGVRTLDAQRAPPRIQRALVGLL